MATARKDLNQNRNNFTDFEIVYPFCYKSKNGKEYFRYLEDGRFENIHISDNRCCMLFGTFQHTLIEIANETNFYLKIVANLNIVIDQTEFEFARMLYMSYYNKYLNGEAYTSREVEKLMKLREIDVEKDKEEFYKHEQNDIIKNEEFGEQEPF